MARERPNRSRNEPGQRQLRVSELLRKALADVFLRVGVEDAALNGVVITVCEVTVSPDLRQATAFVMPLGGGSQTDVVAALERHKKFVRGEVSKRVSLKFMPAIGFKLDTSFNESEHIDTLLRSPKVARDVGPDRP